MRIVCEYCNASNPEKEKICVACGAPLPKIKPAVKTPKSTKPVSVEKTDHSIETAEKIANLTSSIWLAVFDAIIIAAVSLAIGITGGVVEQPVAGVAGAALLGFSVSISIKNSLTTIISAPIGLLLGSILCIIAMLLHFPTYVFPILLTAAACFTAVYGGHKVPYKFRTTWLKIRPYLGTIGGLIFGLIGMGLGLGLQVVYTNFLQFLQELG